MANLSDPRFSAPSAAPAWMQALAGGGGFTADARFSGLPPRAPEPDPAEEIAAEAHARGFAEGRAAALGDCEREDQARARLRLALTRLDSEEAERLKQRLAQAVLALCEATLAPAAIDPDLLNARCLRAVALLGESAGAATIRCHPDDLAALDPAFAEQRRIETDATLERGAIRVEGPDGGLSDGPAEWRRQLAEALALC